MSFAQKLLTIEFQLANGQFSGGGNTLTLSGVRASARISATSGTSNSNLDELIIYGMTLSQMNQLSRIGRSLGTANPGNRVTVTAQDGVDGQQTVVFTGIIFQAYVDGQEQPHVRFIVTGRPDGVGARKPIPATTKKGSAKAQDLAKSLASAMGFPFENNGISVTLRNPYLWGTGVSQMRQLSKAANFVWGIDPGTNVLAIWPKGEGRKNGRVPTISPHVSGPSELIGYPMFSNARIIVTAYFDPQVQPFGKFKVVSSLTAAQGEWWMSQMILDLDTYTPHGAWEMTLIGDYENQVPSAGAN